MAEFEHSTRLCSVVNTYYKPVEWTLAVVIVVSLLLHFVIF